MDEHEQLGGSIDTLESSAEIAARSVAALSQEVARNGVESQRAAEKYGVSTASISGQLSRAFDGLIHGGGRLSDVLTGVQP